MSRLELKHILREEHCKKCFHCGKMADNNWCPYSHRMPDVRTCDFFIEDPFNVEIDQDIFIELGR